MAYALCTLGTQCKEQYDLPTRCIDMTPPALGQHCSDCIVCRWDDGNPGFNQCNLWSWQNSWNTEQCDSVASLLALETTRPCQQGSRFQVTGYLSLAWEVPWLEAFHCHDTVLQHLHSAHETTPPCVNLSLAESWRWPHDDLLVSMLL